jgi:Histone-like transcription factor (CBF/NF-Y) and archaeal histone
MALATATPLSHRTQRLSVCEQESRWDVCASSFAVHTLMETDQAPDIAVLAQAAAAPPTSTNGSAEREEPAQQQAQQQEVKPQQQHEQQQQQQYQQQQQQQQQQQHQQQRSPGESYAQDEQPIAKAEPESTITVSATKKAVKREEAYSKQVELAIPKAKIKSIMKLAGEDIEKISNEALNIIGKARYLHVVACMLEQHCVCMRH